MEQNKDGNDGWSPLKTQGFMELIGPLLRQKRENGEKRYGLHIVAQHLNALGVVHGGVLSTLLDQTIALEAWNAADRQPTLTVQLDTRFVGAARDKDFLFAVARVRHASRSMMFVDADVLLENGTLIASATAIMKIAKRETANV
nr:PaaI family thioesterase [uncultured Cohaesibacter sp.]